MGIYLQNLKDEAWRWQDLLLSSQTNKSCHRAVTAVGNGLPTWCTSIGKKSSPVVQVQATSINSGGKISEAVNVISSRKVTKFCFVEMKWVDVQLEFNDVHRNNWLSVHCPGGVTFLLPHCKGWRRCAIPTSARRQITFDYWCHQGPGEGKNRATFPETLSDICKKVFYFLIFVFPLWKILSTLVL